MERSDWPTWTDMLANREDWVNEAKRDDDPKFESPFDSRGEHKDRQPPQTGTAAKSPKQRPRANPDDLEIQCRDVDSQLEIHEAFRKASNLNGVRVCEGEGMPEDASGERAGSNVFICIEPRDKVFSGFDPGQRSFAEIFAESVSWVEVVLDGVQSSELLSVDSRRTCGGRDWIAC